MKKTERQNRRRRVTGILLAAAAVMSLGVGMFTVYGDSDPDMIYGVRAKISVPTEGVSDRKISIYGKEDEYVLADAEDSAALGIAGNGGEGIGGAEEASSEAVRDAGLIYGIPLSGAVKDERSDITILLNEAAKADGDFSLLITRLRAYLYLKSLGFSDASAAGAAVVFAAEHTELSSDQIAEKIDALIGLAGSELPLLREGMDLESFQRLSEPADAALLWYMAGKRQPSEAEQRSFVTAAAEFYSEWQGYDGEGFDIIEEGLQYVGNPYVYAGNNLYSGIDCSHYVWQILVRTGHYSGSYSDSAGFRELGREVSYEELRPGDVLCWKGHVGFYLGESCILNAASPELGICVMQVDIQKLLGGLLTIRRFD